MKSQVYAAIIDDYKILLVRKGTQWSLPGGEPKPNESDSDYLSRELMEGLSGTRINNLRKYRDFQQIRLGAPVQARVYFADIKGLDYFPSGQISESIKTKSPMQFSLSNDISQLIETIFSEGYLTPPKLESHLPNRKSSDENSSNRNIQKKRMHYLITPP